MMGVYTTISGIGATESISKSYVNRISVHRQIDKSSAAAIAGGV